MRFLKSLYLSDRFFYAMACCIALFIISYSVEAVYYVALGLFVITLAAVAADIALLYGGKKTEARRSAPSVFSLHDPNEITLRVESLGRTSLRLRVIDEIPHQFRKRDLSFTLRLAPGERQVLKYSLVPTVRGVYEFGDLHVYVSSFIGLLVKRETSASQKEVAVYPSVTQMARQQLMAMNHPAFSGGESRNRRLGQSYEFDKIKNYVPGDDTRHINWKASSTMREIMVNLYEDERSQQVYSVIDKSRVMKSPFAGLPLVDHAINATLAFSNIVLKKQDKAGLMIFSRQPGTTLKAERGSRQLKKIMYALYKEEYDYAEADYEALYTSIRRNIPNRSLLFLYTNFETLNSLERKLRILKLINTHHLLVVVFFENAELESFAAGEAHDLLDIYQLTMARRFLLEKTQISRELERHGILSIRCKPENLSPAAINKYLELKARGRI